MHNYAKMNDIINGEVECPFPIGIIPNNMGINLCAVEGISWIKQKDEQLVSLTVHFNPE